MTRILQCSESEITDLIEDEIISRYFYEDGAIEWTIKKDEQILKALEILNNKEEYESVLKGKAGSILVTRKNDQNDLKPAPAPRRKSAKVI